MISPDTIFQFGAISVAAGLGIWVYISYIKPGKFKSGFYLNPRTGRRKIPFIVTPDAYGYLKGIIDEEGNSIDGIYSTLVIEMEGKEIMIPHVNTASDLFSPNPKQLFAGGEAPLVFCVVDRNGQRWSTLPRMMFGSQPMVNQILMNDINEIRSKYARLKSNVNAIRTDEALNDHITQRIDAVAKLRKSILGWGNDEQNQEGGNQQ